MDILSKIFYTQLFTIGGAAISLSSLVKFFVVMFIALSVSKYLQRLIRSRVLTRFGIEEALQFTIGKFLHYVIVIVGLLIALGVVGIPLTGLMVVASAIGIGMGFGMQNVTSNFVSGVMMLFERPIKIGDRITVGDIVGDVKAINIRSTVVVTPDNIAMIVPNSEFIANRVTNWSYGDRSIRLRIPIGVAYGSDVSLVKDILMDVALKHGEVLKEPGPEVWFVGFGESSLDFELLVWIPEPTHQPKIRSDLNYAIDEAFRQNKIEIPFPQRDIHIRSSGDQTPTEVAD